MNILHQAEHTSLEGMIMTNSIADDFFTEFVKDIVMQTLNELIAEENFFQMVDTFSIEEKMTPIIVNAIDKKYEMQMEKVKDGRL